MRFWGLVIRVIGDLIPVVLMVVTTTAIALDVIARTAFHRPLFAASEIALIAFVWLVWLGTVGIARRDEMVGITYFREHMGPLRRPAELLSDVLVMSMCGYVLYATWRQVSTARFTVFDQLPLPKWILAAGVGLAMALLVLIYAGRLWLALRGRGQRSNRPGGMTEP